MRSTRDHAELDPEELREGPGRARALHDDEEGAGVLEYALVAGVISVALITLASTMGGTVISTATTKLAGVFT